ncbi:MAG: ABC transporter ATP-binding protein [Planctomycetota bacterium]|nr:MAG: ABC transporter ATP-binding protein [Planctomycetota bacterium]
MASPESADAAAPEGGSPRYVVEFRNVRKTFVAADGSECVAIDKVNFRVEDLPGKGEFVVLLGPSGCGKSTILNLIAGLHPVHPASGGEVLVGGRPVAGPGPDRGMVFQTYSSYPCYTVLENVAFGLALQGVDKEEREERAMRWIRRVHLEGSEFKYPHQLSGGMRQRVALARTLAVHPRIILMDEPFGALDRVTRWEMQDLLIELWHDVEATVFLITHDIAEAVYLGDRIYILSASPGTILEEVKVPVASGQAAVTQRTTEFAELVNEVSRKFESQVQL